MSHNYPVAHNSVGCQNIRKSSHFITVYQNSHSCQNVSLGQIEKKWRSRGHVRVGVKLYTCESESTFPFVHISLEAEFMNELVEVSAHYLESSQSSRFFLCGCFKPQGRGYGFLSGFPSFSFTAHSNWTVETVIGCVSLKKYKSQGKAVDVTVNSKEENS